MGKSAQAICSIYLQAKCVTLFVALFTCNFPYNVFQDGREKSPQPVTGLDEQLDLKLRRFFTLEQGGLPSYSYL